MVRPLSFSFDKTLLIYAIVIHHRAKTPDKNQLQDERGDVPWLRGLPLPFLSWP